MQRNDKVWHATIWGILNLLLISAFESKKNKLGVPTFLPTPTNVTVNTGEQAILQCAIANLGTKTVSWLKKLPKKHPLTVGTYTFIEDANISVFHNNRTHEWNLLIKDVKISHSGVYECQVSSTEKLSRLVQLTVKDGVSKPSVHISGTAYVENTEVIEITCNATSGGRPPRDITWFKDGEIITPDPNNDRIQIHTHIHMVARSLISKLVIERSHLEDAGIYVCRTSDLKATEFKVHVLNTYDVLTVRIGEPTKLQCNVTAHGGMLRPSPIMWFKQDEPLTANSEVKLFINQYKIPSQRMLLSVFSILDTKFEDSGVYICKTMQPDVTEIRRFKVEVVGPNANDNTSTSHKRRDNYDHKGHGGKRSGDDSGSKREASLSMVCFILTQVVYWCLMMQPS